MSDVSNYQPVLGNFDSAGNLLQMWGPNGKVAFDPASVALTGGAVDYKPVGTSQTLKKWRAAVARAKFGGAAAKIACIGDSITAGQFGTSDAWTNQKINAYPTWLAARLTDLGLTAKAQSFWADSYRTLISAMSAVDPRLNPGSGWILNGDTTALGGNPYSQSAVGGAFAFTPKDRAGNSVSVDTFDVWFANQTGNGVISAQIDALTATTANTGTQGPIGKITLSTTLGAHTCNVSWSSGGQVVLLGIEARNSTTDLVSVWNMGAAGARASVWTSFSGSSPWGAQQALPVLAPDLTIIEYGVNEWLQGYSPITYQADLQAVIATALQTGDVLLWTGPPSITSGSAGSFATAATQQSIVSAMQTVATANNVPIVDVWHRWTDFATSNALGLYGDGAIHPNGKGYYDIANAFASVLALV